MATFQMTLDDNFKADVDKLFAKFGLDTEEAVKCFFRVSLARDALPFSIKNLEIPDELLETIRDVRERRNLYGPFDNAEEAVASMLKDDD